MSINLPGVPRRSTPPSCSEPTYVFLPCSHIPPLDVWAEPMNVQVSRPSGNPNRGSPVGGVANFSWKSRFQDRSWIEEASGRFWAFPGESGGLWGEGYFLEVAFPCSLKEVAAPLVFS